MGNRKIHTYAASFGDDLAKQLIEQNSKLGDTILDPFSGASTSLVQGRILGRSGIGIDIDPVACLIARVTTRRFSRGEIDEIGAHVRNRLAHVSEVAGEMLARDVLVPPGCRFSVEGYDLAVPSRESISYWFNPVQRAVLAVLVEMCKGLPAERREVPYLAISAAIVHKWPNTISLARDIDHSRPHRGEREGISIESQVRIFERRFNDTIRTLKLIAEAECKSDTSYVVREGDAAREIRSLGEGIADYVITSPPYFNAIDYPRAHKFSEWWLWPEREPIGSDQYIGLRPGGPAKQNPYLLSAAELIPNSMPAILPLKKQASSLFTKFSLYVVDMNEVISALRTAMKRGATMSLVIANNVVKDIPLPVVQIVLELLERNGFSDAYQKERRIQSNKRRYPYGIRGFKGLMDTEYVISAKK